MTARHTSELEALLVDDAFDGDIYPSEPMARHTTYRIGGPARFYVQVGSIGALSKLVATCERTGAKWVVVGRGSNLLVADGGYDGVVISLGRDFRNMRYDEASSCIQVGAGALLSSVVQEAFHRSLAGLEFAVGTPGSVGGAVRMNAGTRTQGFGSCLRSVTTFSLRDGLSRRPGSAIGWGYRSCSLSSDEVVVECEVSVKPADPFYIRGKMEASLAKRRGAQPLSQASCGSVFKNPEGAHAAKLIEDAGLKGVRIGGAQVSEKHANFIVNADNASADDVRSLILHVQQAVHDSSGVTLIPEVRFLGFE